MLALKGGKRTTHVRKGRGLYSLCLSSRFAKKTPTTTVKSMLLQAGLGCKKIKLLADDTEEDVLNKLASDAKDEFGNTLGFP